MKNFLNTTVAAAIISVASLSAAQAAPAAKTSAQTSEVPQYIWTSGELGLIANPAYKAMKSGMVDRTQGLYVVGTGENEQIANKAFANIADTKTAPLFKAGVGEISLIELKPAAKPMSLAAK